MERHELTDEQWELVEPMVPRSTARTGRPAKDRRLMLNGALWILATGSPWRDLHERFGSCKTVHRYFCNWRRIGVFGAILEALQIKLDNKGLIDWDLWCVDGASVRATRAAAGARKDSLDRHPDEPADHALGRSRGGFGSKFHVVTDGEGTPLVIEVTAGQVHELTVAKSVIGHAVATLIGRRRKKWRRKHKPTQLAGDKGYSAKRLRSWLDGQKIEPVIPHKDNEKARHDPAVWFDRLAYRGRCGVEQCVGWLKEFRRIGTRYEKLAVNFHGMLQLAMMQRYLRLLF